MAAVSPARNAAFRILRAVERGEAHSDDLLRAKSVSALAPADRNLATTLVLGVLRWQIALDQRIKKNLAKPSAKLDPEVRIALRLGAFQLFHLDRIPAHAAIDESVELVKRAGHRFAAGMVNAVLRKLAAQNTTVPLASQRMISEQTVADQTIPEQTVPEGRTKIAQDEVRRVSGGRNPGRVGATENRQGILPLESPASGSHAAPESAYPAWMLDRWTRAYGSAATCSICRYGQQQSALSIRLADPAAEVELQAEGIQLAPGALLASARTVLSGDVTGTSAYSEGRVRIQDEGSQLIAEIAARAGGDLIPQGEDFLDACAAPGGKTLILAERHPGARIVACEASPQRLAQLRDRLCFLGGRIECRLADTGALKEDSVFDLALADVPCSGTGTLGRNPEIRHRLTAADLPRQAKRQHAILQAALHAVRPGGRVIYSTCSLEPEENEEVVSAVLAEDANARQLPVGAVLESMRRTGIITEDGAERLGHCVTPEGALRLLPGQLGTDGFFVAVLERVSERDRELRSTPVPA